MLYKRVAILGAPLVGKSTILEALSRLGSDGTVKEHELYVDYLQRIVIASAGCKFSVLTVSGPVFYAEATLRYLLSLSDVIVYVFSAAAYDPHQETTFALCRDIARELKKTWTDIPWLFAMNKVDKGRGLPLRRLVEKLPGANIIEVAALTGFGIRDLAEELLRASGSARSLP